MDFFVFVEWRGWRQKPKPSPPPTLKVPQITNKDEFQCRIVNEENFNETVIDSDENVLVEFYDGLVVIKTPPLPPIFLTRSPTMI